MIIANRNLSNNKNNKIYMSNIVVMYINIYNMHLYP